MDIKEANEYFDFVLRNIKSKEVKVINNCSTIFTSETACLKKCDELIKN